MVNTPVDALILDLLDWLSKRDRSYQEAMEAWRSSCPRLPVWEEANDRGLILREDVNGRCIVKLTPSGHALLKQHNSPQDIKPDRTARPE
jgi:D-3-phosphoglycerate dehydrogenase